MFSCIILTKGEPFKSEFSAFLPVPSICLEFVISDLSAVCILHLSDASLWLRACPVSASHKGPSFAFIEQKALHWKGLGESLQRNI